MERRGGNEYYALSFYCRIFLVESKHTTKIVCNTNFSRPEMKRNEAKCSKKNTRQQPYANSFIYLHVLCTQSTVGLLRAHTHQWPRFKYIHAHRGSSNILFFNFLAFFFFFYVLLFWTKAQRYTPSEAAPTRTNERKKNSKIEKQHAARMPKTAAAMRLDRVACENSKREGERAR